LGQAGTEKFLERGLDRWNQVDWLQQIRRGAQARWRAKEAPPQSATTDVRFVVGDGMTASGAPRRFG
jgi:hypothetical protein